MASQKIAKVPPETVVKILKLVNKTTESGKPYYKIKELSARFGVWPGTIRDIQRRAQCQK
jgi:hypothetical protein